MLDQSVRQFLLEVERFLPVETVTRVTYKCAHRICINIEPHNILFVDDTLHGYTFLNVATLQELEGAGRQRFAQCDVLPAVYFGERSREKIKVFACYEDSQCTPVYSANTIAVVPCVLAKHI